MSRALRIIMPIGWTGFFLVPITYIVWWLIESRFDVAIAPDSFRFERPWAAALLPAFLLVLAAHYVHEQRGPRVKMSRVHDLALAQRAGWRACLRHAPIGARAVAVVLLSVALMGPQSIHARDSAQIEGIDIVLTLDMSLSMQAGDIQPNRFVATQQVVDDFVQRRPNDRIGAVVFGRDAFTLMPLTTDKEALRGAISELQLGMVDGRGTAIGNAVGTSLNRLRDSEAASRVIILLTDGDSNSGNVSPEQAAEIARTMPHPLGSTDADGHEREGVKIYTILMGRSDDAPVQQGTDIFGRPLFDRGNYPINPELLREMAETTGGEYFQVADRQGLENSFHQILDRLERSEIEDTGRVFGELFPALVWPAVLLLLLEVILRMVVLRRWP
ncbi:MAG: VWA domain-containing protein [Myxococcales bacterium]|nr:VWA domain-containing protein [Myxococcales bacterium]